MPLLHLCKCTLFIMKIKGTVRFSFKKVVLNISCVCLRHAGTFLKSNDGVNIIC